MSEWAPRRFWQDVSVGEDGAGWAVFLDERPLRTPEKAALLAPTSALAVAVAGEWRAQGEVVDPQTMPFTRSLNAAIDSSWPSPAIQD